MTLTYRQAISTHIGDKLARTWYPDDYDDILYAIGKFRGPLNYNRHNTFSAYIYTTYIGFSAWRGEFGPPNLSSSSGTSS